MAANPVLVDSSYYISLAREGIDPLRTLAEAALERDLAVCGVVRCEVGRGLREERLRSRFKAFWDVMLNVPTDNKLWVEAEEMAWSLGREGLTLPLTDIVIACCAKRLGATILTFDKHFWMIDGVTAVSRLV